MTPQQSYHGFAAAEYVWHHAGRRMRSKRNRQGAGDYPLRVRPEAEALLPDVEQCEIGEIDFGVSVDIAGRAPIRGGAVSLQPV